MSLPPLDISDEQAEMLERYIDSLRTDQVFQVRQSYIGPRADEDCVMGIYTSKEKAENALRKLFKERFPSTPITETTMTQGGVRERQLLNGYPTRQICVSGDGLLFVHGAYRWKIIPSDLDGEL